MDETLRAQAQGRFILFAELEIFLIDWPQLDVGSEDLPHAVSRSISILPMDPTIKVK
jgi:hypothetical protein